MQKTIKAYVVYANNQFQIKLTRKFDRYVQIIEYKKPNKNTLPNLCKKTKSAVNRKTSQRIA